jgi:hypothetical protein
VGEFEGDVGCLHEEVKCSSQVSALRGFVCECYHIKASKQASIDLARSPNRRKAFRRFGQLAVNIQGRVHACKSLTQHERKERTLLAEHPPWPLAPLLGQIEFSNTQVRVKDLQTGAQPGLHTSKSGLRTYKQVPNPDLAKSGLVTSGLGTCL